MPHPTQIFGFPIAFPRLFVRPEDREAEQSIHFRDYDLENCSFTGADGWSEESAQIFAQNALGKRPVSLKIIEENTVPSWLWRHKAVDNRTEDENDLRQVINRVVGAATYQGWKENIFTDESSSRSFYEECKYLLMQRFVALSPELLTHIGKMWAYGEPDTYSKSSDAAAPSETLAINNQVIDTIISGRQEKSLRMTWHKATQAKMSGQNVTINFSNIASDWTLDDTKTESVPLLIDVMRFRHNDGTVNIEALRHAVRLSVLLIDLTQSEPTRLAIGFINLAPLLIALALPYDSEAARATAASISSIITAEAYGMSAELAGLRGAGEVFTKNRETMMRLLRNHRRVAYGENNDYEKISVLPVSLSLDSCPDLALAAAARSVWDDTLQLAQYFGLRHVSVTALASAPELSYFMEATTSGLQQANNSVVDEKDLPPFVYEALQRLGYKTNAIKAIKLSLYGAKSLEKAPFVNARNLRKKGINKAAMEKIAAYLPQAKSLRFAITPWIVGIEFCHNKLGIPMAKLADPSFNLLKHLGFSQTEIAKADAYCYGNQHFKNAQQIKAAHLGIFTAHSDAALLRMAAAVQPHLTADLGVKLDVAETIAPSQIEKLVLAAWRQGLHSLNISFVESSADHKAAPHMLMKRKTERHISASAFVHARKSSMPTRKLGGKSLPHAVVTQRSASKAAKTASRRNGRG